MGMLTDHEGPHRSWVVLLNALGWVLLVVVLFAVAATVLTTYDVLALRGFSDYMSLQLAILVALLLWALKFLVDARRYPTYRKYGFAALLAAGLLLLFLLLGVY